jgi:uncharacterized SAM-binding protein YcdF (DUF218 family)
VTWGLVTRKERWGLSWPGRLAILGIILVGLWLYLFRVYPFLATTHRVNASALIVEGWIHDYAIRTALEEFRSNRYQRVFTTGGPVEGNGGYVNDYQTSASVGADLLKKYGLTDGSVQMVPCRVRDRDRTYGSAIALRNWFREHNIQVSGIDVLTENLHARRTQLLFQKAFGNQVRVGIIAVPNPDYDASHWWRYSDGVREVLSESIAYLYARFVFNPSPSPYGKNMVEASQSPVTRQQ